MENDDGVVRTLTLAIRWTGECMGVMGVGHTQEEAAKAFRTAHPDADGRDLEFIEVQPVAGGGWAGAFLE